MSNNTNSQHKNYQPPSQRLAMVIRDTLEVGEKYRQSIEVMEYSQHEKILFDVNIWGKQALQRAQILLRLLRTQKGFEQQWKHTISLSAPTGGRDLHFATGSQYRERVMFSINASVADYINVSTPSIIFLFTFPTKKVHSMSNNLGIDIDNVVNVQLLKEQRGANYDNINHVIMMTSETGAIFDGKTIYATYKKIAGVKADFGITSKTYQMATAFFGTSPNPIGSGGSLIIGHLRKSDLTLPAVEFDTLTGSEIDSNALVKALRQIEDGSMKLGELTLENLNFGDAVTFNDVINTLNRALPDGYPSAENQPNDNNVPTTGKSTFTHHDKRLVVSGKGLTNASPTGTGTFIGNLLGLGDSATLTKATPSQTLPAQSPDEAIADVVAASSGCGYCFIDELTNDQILKLAN